MVFPDLSRSVLSRAWPFGFVFLIVWRILIVRQHGIDHGGVDIHLLFYGSFGITALIVALVYVYGRRTPRRIPRLALCIFCMGGMIISSCALTLEVFSGSRTAAIVGAVIGGIATISGMLGWGSYFKDLSLQLSITYILVAYMADFFLVPPLIMFFPVATVPVLILFSVGAPMCLLMSQGPSDVSMATEGRQPSDANGHDAGEVTSGRNLHGRQTFLSLWRLLVAFAIYSFVLTLRTPVTYQSNQLALFLLSYAALAVTLRLFWALVIRRAYVPLERILQLFFLVFAVGFLLLPLSSGFASEMLSALLFVMTGLIFMLVWIAVVGVAQSSEIHPFVVIGVWGACYGCPRLVFFLVDSVLNRLGYSLDTVVVASLVSLFGLLVAVFLISRPSTGARPFFLGLSRSYHHGSMDGSLDRASWGDLAREYKLTDRESEIFILICAGHSKRYISEHLYISENTVKAHQKKIYAKIGVHSKLDLEEKIWSS